MAEPTKSVDQIMQETLDEEIGKISGMAEGMARPYLPRLCREVQDALERGHYAIVPKSQVVQAKAVRA
jgi:hypothetical protein